MAVEQSAFNSSARAGMNRAELIERHLPLVESIARRFERSGEPLDDLVQVGTIGLIKAVDRFDASRGNKLSTLAAPAIEGEIRHHLRDGAALVRTPQPLHDLAVRLRAAQTSMTAGLARTPTVDELAQAVGVSATEAGKALASGAAVSLDEDASDAPDADGAAHGTESRLLIDGGLDGLPEREQRIVRLRYEQDLSQGEIARREGISQATVSRLLHAALQRLRETIESDGTVAPPSGGAYSRSVAPADPTPAEETPDKPAHSGRLLVRMPATLHGELARAAEREGVSLNTLVTGALAGAVSWRDPDGTHPELERDQAPASDSAPPRPGWLRYALMANLVVVAVAAIVAIALLITAL